MPTIGALMDSGIVVECQHRLPGERDAAVRLHVEWPDEGMPVCVAIELRGDSLTGTDLRTLPIARMIRDGIQRAMDGDG